MWIDVPPNALEVAAIQEELSSIASGVETGSGAPVADSVAFRAAALINSDAPNFKQAADVLTIGLSAAQ